MKQNIETTSDKSGEIISAAQEMFAEYGLKKTTMDDIAHRLGICRSAIYYYYKNKEDIIVAVLKHEMEQYRRYLEDSIGSIPDPMEKIKTFVDIALSLRKKFFMIYKCTIDDYSDFFTIVKDIKNTLLEMHSAIICDILTSDPSGSEVPDIHGISLVFSKALRGIVFNSKEISEELLKNDLIRFLEIMYSGVRNPSRK
jgi:AcrR family transcriptional regulator